ncbi:hypothetical protein GO730_32225 [Spirosoma sp. HMF3257]|uniref:Putative beta-lactamase-inhibitor-like PepSY-like domain-containing protein n=1 Tax=Spirosoma telluris TaxID=2183553 RepID=A0A327NT51_9BACT|nr:hypothetical protein [Spirosoma telluris]RAI77629.1 hypothetical protein HMF3257_32120 [Spirosoma telluris]
MKKILAFGLFSLITVSLWNCNSNNSAISPSTSASARLSTAQIDSVGCRGRGPGSLTSVAAADLPAAITSYITTNYAGATIKLAGKDAKGSYFVAIQLNGLNKALEFDSTGTFVQELEFKGERHDKGPGSGSKEKRDSLNAVNIAALPAAVTSYISKNYAGATIDFAGKATSTGYIVGITVGGVRKALQFNVDGSFNQELPTPTGKHGWGGDFTAVAVADLPAAITTYITTNYAGATINRAGKGGTNGEYVVSITTSDSKHVGLVFNADGTFKAALTKK